MKLRCSSKLEGFGDGVGSSWAAEAEKWGSLDQAEGKGMMINNLPT